MFMAENKEQTTEKLPEQQKEQALPTPPKEEALPAAPANAKVAAPKKRAAPKRKVKTAMSATARGKRKTAVARVSARPGTGIIRVNSREITLVNPVEIREMMLEPISISGRAKDIASKVNISINVVGGGVSSQAQAVRTALARCLVALDSTGILKNELMNYDRTFLVEDPRRVEPKKFKGPKARARFQTSYR